MKKKATRKGKVTSLYVVHDREGKLVYRLDTPAQCPTKLFMGGIQCQGADGHKGPHWCYGPDGYLNRQHNKQDKDSNPYWGASHTPPGHPAYIPPEKKLAECHRCMTTKVRVRDRALCKRLATGRIRHGETVSRPDPQIKAQTRKRVRTRALVF